MAVALANIQQTQPLLLPAPVAGAAVGTYRVVALTAMAEEGLFLPVVAAQLCLSTILIVTTRRGGKAAYMAAEVVAVQS